jgi:Tol biopolymer transport system component
MRKTADGTGEAVVLAEADNYAFPGDWSKDGRYLAYSDLIGAGWDIRYVEFRSDGEVSEPVTFLGTPATEVYAQFSPDGRFVAYQSIESGTSQIYVRPFPDGPGEWQVSVNGGVDPRWRSDGKELYYREGTTLMAVSVSTESTFTRGQPQQLFESPDLGTGILARYDVSADGQRFVTIAPVEDGDEEAAAPKIRIVQNWYEEFRDREQ